MVARMDILEADVLVIGGGFAGCWAALRAADLKATVTLVDDVRGHHDLPTRWG
jgi:succinate dehydrogenase/fumarate reductase flavoprotein subunit